MKKGKVGGSAFEKKTKGLFGLFGKKKRTGKLQENPVNDHVYALKSIMLDRVSPVFVYVRFRSVSCYCCCYRRRLVSCYSACSGRRAALLTIVVSTLVPMPSPTVLYFFCTRHLQDRAQKRNRYSPVSTSQSLPSSLGWYSLLLSPVFSSLHRFNHFLQIARPPKYRSITCRPHRAYFPWVLRFLVNCDGQIWGALTLRYVRTLFTISAIHQYQSAIYLVLDLCDGGDLYERSPYSEREAGRITAQLLSAILYMVRAKLLLRILTCLRMQSCAPPSKNTCFLTLFLSNCIMPAARARG